MGGAVWTGGRGGAPRASARPDDVRASVCALRACALAAGPLPGARWESLLGAMGVRLCCRGLGSSVLSLLGSDLISGLLAPSKLHKQGLAQPTFSPE